jgi:hypothetical protein
MLRVTDVPSDDGRLFIWDKETAELVQLLPADQEVVNQMTACGAKGREGKGALPPACTMHTWFCCIVIGSRHGDAHRLGPLLRYTGPPAPPGHRRQRHRQHN